MTKPTKATKFYKLNLPETLLKKDKPILETLPDEKTTLLKENDLTNQNQT